MVLRFTSQSAYLISYNPLIMNYTYLFQHTLGYFNFKN